MVSWFKKRRFAQVEPEISFPSPFVFVEIVTCLSQQEKHASF